MATQNINIVISSTGGVTVVRNLQQIGQAAENAINPLRRLQTQINAVMGALAIHQITEWADEWVSAANKIAVFSKTQQETNEVLNQLYNIAQKVGQPLNGVVDLYHKLSIQAKALGVSVSDNIRITEIISKALTIQGTSAKAAHGALLQLSQAFGTGKVKAQEYNSLLTGLPLVLKVAAENIKAAGGSVAKLTAMQRAGALSSKMLYDAIQAGGVQIDQIFGNMTRTFAQGFSVAINGISKFLGEMNIAYGVSNKFYALMKFLTDNMGTIAKLLGVIAVGVTAAFAPTIVVAFGRALVGVVAALGRVSALLLANPFVVIATAVAAVIAFGDAWDAGIDNMTTVKDVFMALFQIIIDTLKDFGDLIGAIWEGFKVSTVEALKGVSTVLASSVGGWFDGFNGFFDDVGNGFIGVLRGIAKVMDAIGGLILGVVIGIGRAFGGLPDVISNIFAEVYNNIASWMEKAINVVISGLNTVREKTGASLIDAVSFEKKAVDKSTFENYGESIAASIDAGFAMQGGFMVKQIDALEKKAQLFSANRRAEALKNRNTVDLDSRTDPESITPKGKKAKKDTELSKLQNDLRSLLNRIDPASGALLEMAKAQEVLNKAVERGLITEAERQKYLPLLAQHYKDIIDPLGKYTREINEQIKLSQLDQRTREREAELMRMKQDLMMKGKPMTDIQIEDTRKLLELQQKMNEAMAVRDSLQKGSAAEGARGFGVQVEQMQKLLNDPNSGFKRTDATAALQQQMGDLFDGTRELQEMQVKQWEDMYLKIKQLRDADLISASTAAQMSAKVSAQQTQAQLSNYTSFFGSLEGLSSSSNKKLAAIGKAASVANATIKGYEAVQVALASAPPPYNYALAAGVAIQAASNVAKILSTDTAFATGGEFTVGGQGGVDSQMVAFRASPGEQVNVSTPTQVRKGTAGVTGGGEAAAPTIVKPNIINVLDPSVMSSYMRSADGSAAIINVIQNNPSVIRSAVQGGR